MSAGDALYGLALEQFVAERDALAKQLRAEGDRAAADEVRALRKPTRAAWAVNVAVRAHPEEAGALAEAARGLADAQRELLAGGDASVLREAGERARRAVDALAARAGAAGGSGAAAEKIRATLHAATVDPDVLAEVVAGRLVAEREASGFGGLVAAGPAATGGGRPRAGAQRAPAAKRGGRASGPADADPAPARSGAAREARGAERREREKREAAAQAARDAERRRAKLRRAKEAEAEAEGEVTAARRALEQVESALAERRALVREAEARLRDAQRRRRRAEG
jgi:hypothetical protein